MSQNPPDPNSPSFQPPPPSWAQGQPGQTAQPAQPAYGQPAQPQYAQPAYQPAQPAYQAAGYGQPAGGGFGGPPAKKAHVLAIVGLVLAILLPPIGLIVSIIALFRVRRHGGKGFAVAGTIVGLLFTIGIVIALVALGGLIAFAKGPTDAVTGMNEALVARDCDGFFEVTDAGYRESVGITDCGSFTSVADGWMAGITDYSTQITNLQAENGQAVVDTNETYLLDGAEESVSYTYSLEQVDGDWVIVGVG